MHYIIWVLLSQLFLLLHCILCEISKQILWKRTKRLLNKIRAQHVECGIECTLLLLTGISRS